MTNTTDTTPRTRPLYAQQHDKNGRRITDIARVLEVSDDDWRRAKEGDTAEYGREPGVRPTFWVATTDHATGEAVEVAVAACGLGCRCAAAWRRVR
jgi:hypothetical protein